jgi:hypothetical protein
VPAPPSTTPTTKARSRSGAPGNGAESVLTHGHQHAFYLRKLHAGPRSPRSTRAPTRSSAWSWPASSSRAYLRSLTCGFSNPLHVKRAVRPMSLVARSRVRVIRLTPVSGPRAESVLTPSTARHADCPGQSTRDGMLAGPVLLSPGGSGVSASGPVVSRT